MDVQARNYVVNKYKYCINCLARSHELRTCSSRDACRKCGGHHHTMLHPGIKGRLQYSSAHYRRPAQHSSKKRHSSKKQQSSKNQHHPASPDQRVISEAIRSLANVLCAKPHVSGGRNV